MDEAKDYKAYLKALKEATKKQNKPTSSTSDYIKRRKQLSGINSLSGLKTIKFSCGGMGIAIKGGDFKGVK
tara:strand:- start:344 stop:556 length:213 start_codon:yes stop_codon:yes gene_type:complete